MTLPRRGKTEPRLGRRGRIAMIRCCLAYAAIVICSSVPPLSAAHAQPRAVIELFTSQGCSSCPPADRLLGELAADPSLVPISVPVDYWDYLGWKDTLADPHNTARQKAYAHARGRQRQGCDRGCHREQPEERRDVIAPDTDALRCAAQCHGAGRYGCSHERRSLAVWACQSRHDRNWARREQRPHDHLPQCRTALDEARRLDGQGQFVEYSGTDAQGRKHRRSGGPSSKRHDREAEGDPRGRAGGDPVNGNR